MAVSFRPIFLKSHSQMLSFPKHSLIFRPAKIFDKCALHTTSLNSSFHESNPKGEYKKLRPKPAVKDLIRGSLKQLKKEIEIWKTEVREAWQSDFMLQGLPGVVDKVFQFRTQEDLHPWIVTSDKDNEEGESTCEFTINENGRGLFSGNLCLDVPKDGIVSKTGYCNIRCVRRKGSFQRDSHYDWGMYNHLVIRTRGDGRSYAIHLSTSSYFDLTWNDIYTYVLFTRGGPYWQYSRIPFSKFFYTSKGRIQDRQFPVPLDHIASLGFTMSERTPGPFSLEIDFIGLENDPSHKETFAYEMYKLPAGFAQT